MRFGPWTVYGAILRPAGRGRALLTADAAALGPRSAASASGLRASALLRAGRRAVGPAPVCPVSPCWHVSDAGQPSASDAHSSQPPLYPPQNTRPVPFPGILLTSRITSAFAWLVVLAPWWYFILDVVGLTEENSVLPLVWFIFLGSAGCFLYLAALVVSLICLGKGAWQFSGLTLTLLAPVLGLPGVFLLLFALTPIT